MNYKRIIIAKDKEKSLQRLHPWLFSGAIKRMESDINEGDLVNIYSSEKQFLATGIYQSGTIAVKVLSFKEQEIDDCFWEKRIRSAVNLREELGFFDNKDTNIFRLINAEGDFLPSLIADFYDGLLVLQFHSVGILLQKEAIITALLKVLGSRCKAIFNKSSSTLPKNGGIFTKDDFLFGQIEREWTAKESGNIYLIDYFEGQKTGFFIDQRQNRALLQSLSKDKSVLNCFGYSGGFSVSALRGGAKDVQTLDISQRAIELCNRNVGMNFAQANHQSSVVNVMDFVQEMPKNAYDIIVLDPPAFVKHRTDMLKGLKTYRQINQNAIHKVKKNGLILTFSCSQALCSEDFETMLFSCAATLRRKVRIIQRLPHALDHPQSIFHPEGEYLKGVLLAVD
jgi:23S rRNA (cytosine1962-C5)-methyltransferase